MTSIPHILFFYDWCQYVFYNQFTSLYRSIYIEEYIEEYFEEYIEEQRGFFFYCLNFDDFSNLPTLAKFHFGKELLFCHLSFVNTALV